MPGDEDGMGMVLWRERKMKRRMERRKEKLRPRHPLGARGGLRQGALPLSCWASFSPRSWGLAVCRSPRDLVW